MVDIKAIQEVIDYLASHEDAQSYIITAERLRAEKQKLEKAVQGGVPYNCDMLEEHITGGGEHANIEERLCRLEGILTEKSDIIYQHEARIYALEKKYQGAEGSSVCDIHCGPDVTEEKVKAILDRLADKAMKDIRKQLEKYDIPVNTTASAEKRCAQCNQPLSTEFGATYQTDAIPGEVYCSAQCGWEAATDRLERPQARQCDQCGADIEVLYETHLLPKRVFCSRECTTIAADRPKLALMSDDDPTPEYRGPRCDRCNAPLGFNAYSSGALPGKIFCGAECAWKAEVEQRLDQIEEAPKHGETCPNCSGTGIIRYTVGCAGHKETKEYQCIRCGGKGMI